MLWSKVWSARLRKYCRDLDALDRPVQGILKIERIDTRTPNCMSSLVPGRAIAQVVPMTQLSQLAAAEAQALRYPGFSA